MTPVAMSLLLSVLVSSLVLTTGSAPKSSQDQYVQRNDQAQTETNGHIPAVHRVQLSSSGLHRFGLLPRPLEKQELQVGCGDGTLKVIPKEDPNTIKVFRRKKRNIHRDTQEDSKLIKREFEEVDQVVTIENKRNKRDNAKQMENLDLENNSPDAEETKRSKRDYIRWFGAATTQYNPPIQSFQFHGYPNFQNVPTTNQWSTRYQNPYQILVPIWGNPRRVPIFFPAKPILFNPGFPIINPPRMEPIPVPEPNPNQQEVTDPATTGMTLENRFGDPNKDDDSDAPVWGIVESAEQGGTGGLRTTTQRPRTTSVRPTQPPLFHRPSKGERGEGNLPSNMQTSVAESNVVQIDQNELQSIRTTTPPPQTTTRGTERQLNRCVWSIISCCNPTNTQIRYNCFENLGCPGAFWDRNPCSKEVTQAALNAAQEFYSNS